MSRLISHLVRYFLLPTVILHAPTLVRQICKEPPNFQTYRHPSGDIQVLRTPTCHLFACQHPTLNPLQDTPTNQTIFNLIGSIFAYIDQTSPPWIHLFQICLCTAIWILPIHSAIKRTATHAFVVAIFSCAFAFDLFMISHLIAFIGKNLPTESIPWPYLILIPVPKYAVHILQAQVIFLILHFTHNPIIIGLLPYLHLMQPYWAKAALLFVKHYSGLTGLVFKTLAWIFNQPGHNPHLLPWKWSAITHYTRAGTRLARRHVIGLRSPIKELETNGISQFKNFTNPNYRTPTSTPQSAKNYYSSNLQTSFHAHQNTLSPESPHFLSKSTRPQTNTETFTNTEESDIESTCVMHEHLHEQKNNTLPKRSHPPVTIFTDQNTGHFDPSLSNDQNNSEDLSVPRHAIWLQLRPLGPRSTQIDRTNTTLDQSKLYKQNRQSPKSPSSAVSSSFNRSPSQSPPLNDGQTSNKSQPPSHLDHAFLQHSRTRKKSDQILSKDNHQCSNQSEELIPRSNFKPSISSSSSPTDPDQNVWNENNASSTTKKHIAIVS